MKKIFNLALCAVCVAIFASCERGGGVVTTDKEEAFEKAMTPYVQNTVIATYGNMANEGLILLDDCEKILAAQEAGQDYSALIQKAQGSWRAMRKYWEQSEAFLYGPASAHNIDPHIAMLLYRSEG